MTMTLGKALTEKDDRDVNVRNRSIDEGLNEAKRKLRKEGKSFDREALDGPLRRAVFAALDVTLDEMMGQAWRSIKDLHIYADDKKTPPDEVNTVTLSDHSIESVYEPSVDVVVSNVTVKTFKFDVAAHLNVRGANLVVQGGKIREIKLARLELGGSVSLGDHVILEHNITEIPELGVMRLANPIPISRGRA